MKIRRVDFLKNLLITLTNILGDRKALDRCAELLSELGQTSACSEIYGKMGDWEKLIQLYAKSGQWDEAFQLVNRNPELSSICWTLRADWLAERDMFIEAQQAFHQAGKKEEALFVLLKESYFFLGEFLKSM